MDERMKMGFSNFSNCLNIYINQLEDYEILVDEIDENEVTIYGSVILENGAIIRATNNYHGKPWFSNVSVCMNSEELFNYITDKGICYGQVIIII